MLVLMLNLHLSIHLFSLHKAIAVSLQIVASKLKDPICHSNECQIGSFSSEATKWGSHLCTVFYPARGFRIMVDTRH